MRRKIRIRTTALVVILAAMLAAMPAPARAATAAAPSGNPIRIGGSLPLTGVFSETGRLVKEGYDAWAEDVNRRGGLLGRPVQLIIYDDESSAEKAVTYYERAITIDKVDLVFGGYPGTANVAIMPLVEKYAKVFVGMGGHMKSFEQGFTYTFASPPLMSDWAYLTLQGPFDEFVPKAEWPKTMAVLTMNNVIGLSAKGNVIKWAEKNGIKVVVDESYNLPLSDANPLVSRAKARGADILCCLSMFDDGVTLTRAAKAMNYSPKLIYQLIASVIPAWMREMGPDGNNVLSDMWWTSKLPFPGNDAINAAAKSRLGLPAAPTYFGMGFCWMKTLELAVEGAKTLDNTRLRDYLRTHKFDLPYGLGITFDRRGLPPPFAYAVQTTKGAVEVVWPRSVATTKFVYPRPPWSR